jgi:succinyl-diaminopimelate desuccinylase
MHYLRGDLRLMHCAVGSIDTVPEQSIIKLASELIKIPSQGGIDDQLPGLLYLQQWFGDNGIPTKIISDQAPVGLISETHPLSHLAPVCLTACIDTAPVGDHETWLRSPYLGEIVDQRWLFGRGSADSKVGLSIFAHVFRKVFYSPAARRGLVFLADADEHNGRFGAIRAFSHHHRDALGVYIGYPGPRVIQIGCRGFFRAKVEIFGEAGHTGFSDRERPNAIVRAARFVELFEGHPLKATATDDFKLLPKKTIVMIQGGKSYSIVPDKCTLHVDFRLTKTFDVNCAKVVLNDVIGAFDGLYPFRKKTRLTEGESWPAYSLASDTPIVSALSASIKKVTGKKVPPNVCGASNVGNFLAKNGVPAICGYGVAAQNIHAANERADIKEVGLFYQSYLEAVTSLINSDSDNPPHLSGK